MTGAPRCFAFSMATGEFEWRTTMGEGAPQVIRLEATRTFSVEGNLIDIEKVEGHGDLPDGIYLENCRNGCVSGNVVTGAFRHGVRLSAESPGVIVGDNGLAEASGEEVYREEN